MTLILINVNFDFDRVWF